MSYYGLPNGSQIPYGGPGFPQWVYDLADVFGVQASTYPDHQEGQRAEKGFAPNPQRLNRGIDWAGPVPNMQRLADYLLSVRGYLEQVIWENPNTGQRVGVAGGDDVTRSPYYADDYAGHRDHVHTRQSQPIPLPGGVVMQQQPPRPAFTEVEAWSHNTSPRNGVKIDLFLLHTQEGGDGDAFALAQWMNGHDVSYHYTVSTSRTQVTVCDVVDTDLASWSVLSANPRSINLCFAGSKASWSRQEWLNNKTSIDVAAYLAVQDCRKYGIPITVIAPPYTTARAGITDHNYVTKVLRDGTHTDVGPNFPWDVFTAAVAKYAGTTTAPEPPKPPAPTTPGGFMSALSDAEQRALYDEIMSRRPSRSPLRRIGEGVVDDIGGMLLNTDGSVHVLLINLLARLGDPDALALLREVAGADVNRYPDRKHDRLLAQAILNDIDNQRTVESASPTGQIPGLVVAESPPPPTYTTPAPAYTTPQTTGTGVQSGITSLQSDIETLRSALTGLTTQIRS